MTALSVIMVEYHGIDDVVSAMASIQNHLGGLEWQAIVVSNSEYPSEKAHELVAAVPQARVIISEQNSGYAGGVNRALHEIDTPYAFLLNPDGRFTDGGLSKLLEVMEQQPDVAIVGPRVVDEKGVVQPSCRRFPRIYTFLLVRSFLRRFPGALTERRRYLMEDFDHQTSRTVEWVSGGAMLIRMNAVKQVGGMDERYFLYMEDVDWCRSFGMSGWVVRYEPFATVMHAGQHASIQSGMLTRNTRWHLQSMAKYFIKYLFV